MSNQPFVSIIVPVYNTEEYLECCLDSILAQDYTDYELILVDDGSTDGSGTICKRYAEEHSQIHYIHQPNGGHTCARQNGFLASRGDYITFVDSDDWLAPGMYSHMCRIARETHADIVHCNFTAAMPHKQELCGVPFPPGFYDKNDLTQSVYPSMVYSGVYFKFGVAPRLTNKLFVRSLIEKYLFLVPHGIVVGEDGPVTYGAMLAASSVYFCEESYYYYRSNPTSLCHHMDAGRIGENHTMFETYRQAIDLAANPGILRQLQYFYVYQSLLTFVPVFRAMRTDSLQFKRLFLEECDNKDIQEAFAVVPVKDITGIHNKLYAFCVRHRLWRLFRFLLAH